jgi:hypothetical protein
MRTKKLHRPDAFGRCCLPAVLAAMTVFFPENGFATQMHHSSEGIITHQIGHLFFLFSMIVLIFTVTGKGLVREKGWRLIQVSAFFFVLWNIDALAAHFLDNQIYAVELELISFKDVRVITNENSLFLAYVYYFLKMDHLLCVPAIFFLYRGLSRLLADHQAVSEKEETR